jgi:hypothetical protein
MLGPGDVFFVLNHGTHDPIYSLSSLSAIVEVRLPHVISRVALHQSALPVIRRAKHSIHNRHHLHDTYHIRIYDANAPVTFRPILDRQTYEACFAVKKRYGQLSLSFCDLGTDDPEGSSDPTNNSNVVGESDE